MKTFISAISGTVGRQTLAALTILAAVASIAPANAASSKASCTIFAPAQVIPGQNFDLRISRVPGYPGGWFSPTFNIKVSYPAQPGWAYVQSEIRTIPKMNVIRADMTLRAPSSLFPDPSGGFVQDGTVNIVVVVEEASRGKPSRILCTASSVIGI